MPTTNHLDNLYFKIYQKMVADPAHHDTRLSLSATFINVCRVKHRQMHEVSKKFWKYRKRQLDKREQDWFQTMDEATEARVNYLGLIEELNRFGRVYESKYGLLMPEYKRIRFYRNKVIEHWDDYEAFLESKGNGLIWQKNKLVIPYHMGRKHEPPKLQAAYKDLHSEFTKCGVTLPPLDHLFYKEYSDIVFLNLEKIDPELNNRQLLNDNLINSLFRYNFPTPIHDLEEYSHRLTKCLEDFLGL